MKKSLIVILAMVIILAGGFWLIKLNSQNKVSVFGSPLEALAKESIVLEVIQGQTTVSLSGQEKTLSAPLNQEIDKDATITTLAASQANIIFPSGSMARLDENTTVSLTDFSDSGQSILVKLKLEAGNLWSRVQRLADKETDYEVETSNTVAVVRGTSFNMFFGQGKTKLEVLSNKVSLKALDPQTGQFVPGAEAEVEAGKYVEADQAMPSVAQKPLEAKQMAPQDMDRPWFKNNLEKDKKINELVAKNLSGETTLITKEALKQFVLSEMISIKREVLKKENILQSKQKAADKTANPRASSLPKNEEPPVSPSPNQINKATPKPVISSKAQPPAQPVKLGVAGISPNSAPGPSYQYTKVTITGSGFTPQTRASVGSYALGSLKVVSPGVLEGTVPAKVQPGKYDVVLTDGGQKAVLSGGFSIVQAK